MPGVKFPAKKMVKKVKTIQEYEQMTLAQLREEAKSMEMEEFMELQKRELIIEILKKLYKNDFKIVSVEDQDEIQRLLSIKDFKKFKYLNY